MTLTVREIAKKAGVSPATVSLVLNNKRGVGEETRRLVQRVIDECGYQHRHKQRRRMRLVILKYRKTESAYDENRTVMSSLIDYISQRAAKEALRVMVLNCNRTNICDMISTLSADSTFGIIIIGTELHEPEHAMLRCTSLPLVVVDNSMRYSDFDSVFTDNHAIAGMAVQYLYSLGHRTIYHFKSNRSTKNFDERAEGYQRAMRSLGLEIPDPLLLTPHMNGSYADMKRYLRTGSFTPGGAAFADSDSIAIGSLKAMHEAGFFVPEDLSVVGIDDIPFSAVSIPSLTTVRLSNNALGSMALETLKLRQRTPDIPAIHIAVSGTLIERASTARAVQGDGE